MTKPTLFARAGAVVACASFIVVVASCQKIVGIESLDVCDACYSGPKATEGIGACRHGCPGVGGVCVGEILPKTEDCSTPEVDDNCDGKSACTGDVVWTLGGTTPGAMTLMNAAPQAFLTVSSSGDLVAVGSTKSGAAIGRIKAPPMTDKIVSFIADIAADDGSPLSVTTFASKEAGSQMLVADVAPLADDRVAVGGAYQGTPTGIVNGAPLAKGQLSGFVSIFDLKNDKFAGGQALAGKESDSLIEVWSVAALPNGDVFACGDFQGTIVLPDGTSKSSKAFTQDAFVVRFDKSGHVVAKAFFGGSGEDSCAWIRTSEKGDVAIAGNFGGADFEIGTTQLGKAIDDYDLFVAVLDADLVPKWAVPLNATSDAEAVAGVVFDPSTGNVVVGGRFYGSLHAGSASLQAAGGLDLFVATFDPNGKLVWSRAYGDGADQDMANLVVDGAGQIVIAGQFAGRIRAEGCDITSSGGSSFSRADAFVMKLSPDGQGIWCKAAGTSHYQELGSSVVTDAAGYVYATASFIDKFAFPRGAELSCDGECKTGLAFGKLDP